MKDITYCAGEFVVTRSLEDEEAETHLARIANKQMRAIHFKDEHAEYIIPMDKIDGVMIMDRKDDEQQ